MTTTVGWILLFTQVVSFTDGREIVSHNQYDHQRGEPPKMFATKEACQQELQNLVFQDNFPYDVKIVPGGIIFAEGVKVGATLTMRNKVQCFDILDTPN
jgi:hypothetical protein